jgi:chromosome segregation protein
MRLERLEISGFKSFSDRAELAFDGGVTAIVGPNGCGKSNVADALTWVLGEQSAKSLRGDKMEDVIFNGSDARKPGGAAEVRLRLAGLPARPAPASDSPARTAPGLPEFRAHPVPATDRSALPDGHDPDSGINGHQANGTDHRNGHGNGNGNGHSRHAEEVALLDVADLAQAFTRDVEVTRRLYRSGESEYLIDGEVCRLRDVHELLMDTGLGAKATRSSSRARSA